MYQVTSVNVTRVTRVELAPNSSEESYEEDKGGFPQPLLLSPQTTAGAGSSFKAVRHTDNKQYSHSSDDAQQQQRDSNGH